MLLLISFSILLVLYGVLLIALLLDNKVRLELGGGLRRGSTQAYQLHPGAETRN